MSPSTPGSKMRALAQQLVAHEAGVDDTANPTPTFAAFRLSEKLRRYLSRIVGPTGFSTLLRRAVALGKRDVPGLSTVQIKPDGSLEGLSEQRSDEAAEAYTLLLAHLLELLVTFIGEPLTRQVIRDIWADLPSEEKNLEPTQEHD